MTTTRRSRTLLPLLLLCLLPACALAGSGDGEDAGRLAVRVENNLIPPTSLSVFAVSDLGARRLAGVVRPGETTTLSFPGEVAEQYRFSAETAGGREIVSDPVTLGPGDLVVWDVSANLIVPGEGGR